MIENFETIKDYVYKIGEFEQSEKLDLKIQAIVQECLAYCYRKEVSEEMTLPLADVIANEIQKRGLLGVDGDISSYSEGDMSVSFDTANTSNGKSFYNGKLEPFKLVIGALEDV